jgi:hypothetical protein
MTISFSKLTNQELVSVCVALPLPFIMIWTAITSHLLVDKLEQVFCRSLLLQQDRKFIKHLGLLGEMITCGSVFLICLMPRIYIWRGLVLESEVAKMPIRLSPLYISGLQRYCWRDLYFGGDNYEGVRCDKWRSKRLNWRCN